METKATKFEGLLKVARNELESLKERVALLEEQVDIEERFICNGVGDLQMTAAVTDENIRTHNIVHNDNANSFNDDDNNNINNINNSRNTSCCGDQQSRCLTPFTLTFDDQHSLINQPPQISCDVPMLPSAIRDPIFCETRGDLGFCEPINERNITTTTTTNTTITDKCSSVDKSTDKQMWILPTTIPSSLYSDYSPNLELSHQQDYFSPAVSSVVTKTNPFYPLNLKWILSDS